MSTTDSSFQSSRVGGQSDPWSDETWGKDAKDVEFEDNPSDDLDFEATSSVQLGEDEDTPSFFFRDPFALPTSKKVQQHHQQQVAPIRVAMHEQLSALYDDETVDTAACQIEGSIYVQQAEADQQSSSPFRLVLKDPLGHLERVDERTNVCRNVSSDRGSTDRVLQVTLPPKSGSDAPETAIAKYVCVPSLRPVPMLIKSRVQVGGTFCRVGFKVRANPTNAEPLHRMVILLAVPPSVDGERVRMSRKGGIWDEMKRTVSWTVEALEPGQALEIQAQFESLENANNKAILPKFPILIRCEYPTLFSSADMTTADDAGSPPLKIKVSRSGRILHRKV